MNDILSPTIRRRIQEKHRVALALLEVLSECVSEGDIDGTGQTVQALHELLSEHLDLIDAVLDVMTPDVPWEC